MRLIKFSNNAVSRIVAPITNASTTISMTPGDGAKFPDLAAAGSFFMATLIKADSTTEVVKVTARVSDTLTVVRAAEAVSGVTAAYAFNVNDRIEQRLTAGALGNELDRLDAAAVTGAINKNVDYTVTNADVTMLIRVDSTAGLRTITLPPISSLSDDFDITVAKVTGDANVVNVVRSASDTINGMVTYTLNNQWQSGWFVADRSTGSWTAINSGSGGSSINTDSFTVTTPTDAFTLSGNPGTKNNTAVYINGTYQQKATYAVVGNVLTVGAVLPSGATVECVWAQPVSMGVPSDGSVTTQKIADGAITDVKVSSIQSSKISFSPIYGTGSITRDASLKLQERISIKDFGAIGDGIADDSAAFVNAMQYTWASAIYVPAGTYNIAVSSNVVISLISNKTLIGDGPSSVLKMTGSYNLYFKSCSNLYFQGIKFSGAATNSIVETIWFTNFSNITFDKCVVSGFGGSTVNIAGSCAICMYAGDTSNSLQASGDSSGARFIDCLFDGNSRMTNFAVRCFTEFSTVENAVLSDCSFIGCTFNGFNWNAVELAGNKTKNCIISACTANLCGLAPFDIDKAASNCVITNITINRLLGNIDTVVNPNTRAVCAEIQGTSATGGYAEGNIISGVTARLLASDIAAFAGTGGFSATSLAYAKNSSIVNVNVTVDSVPAPGYAGAFGMAISVVATTSGCTLEDIRTVNATHGIMETETRNGSVGFESNSYVNIINSGSMKGECVSLTKGAATQFYYFFKDVHLSTDLLLPYISTSLVDIAGTATSGAFVAFERCNFSTANASAFGVNNNAYRTSYNNVDIGVSSESKWFKTSSNGVRVHFAENLFSGDQADVSNAFTNLAATCVVYQNKIIRRVNFAFPIECDGSIWRGSATPTNPPVAYYRLGTRILFKSPISTGYVGAVTTALGWKNFGAIL